MKEKRSVVSSAVIRKLTKTPRKWGGGELAASLLLMGSLLAAGTAEARNLVWKGTVGDSFATPSLWNIQDTPNFSETPPGPDDKIVISISKPITLDLTDDVNLGVVNGCLGICLAESTSKCYIIAPDGSDKSITAPIVGAYNPLSGDLAKGMVFISGPGTVHLCATNMRSYATRTMDIYGGATVWLPQNGDLDLNAYKMGDVAVSNNATLHLPTRHNGSLNGGRNYVEMERLFGDGTITATELTELRFANSGGVFSGVLDSNLKIFMSGRQMLTGVSSPMTASPRVYNAYRDWATAKGTLGVMKFGKTGELSSIGTASLFFADVRGGTYLYLGEGEETDKCFRLYGNDSGYSVLDAGAVGGLVFTNSGGFRVANGATYNCIAGLSGSNTVPCVIQGQFNENDSSFLVTVVKKGTGTWRFADPVAYGKALPDYRSFHGSISVDEGVLQFDTIAPLGEYCSLGCATVLKGPTLGAWANLPDVGWAFSLGGTNSTLNALAEGTLEYTGTTAGLCEGRRVRLEVDGRFRVNGPKKIRYRMADTTSARAKTLSLDGESMATNEVRGVFDTAANPVSIVKEGGGTWLLGGKGPLHGDVKVKGGKLIVENYTLGSKYTWFKFTIKNLFDPAKVGLNKSAVSVRFFGLYDANGICQTARTLCSEDMRAGTIEPGEAGYATLRKFSKGGYSAATAPYHDHNPTNMFRTSPVYDAIPYNLSGTSSGFYPQIGNERTWIPMVVRLTNGAPAIASYDWAITYGFASGNKGGFHWTPNIWSLEGSVDGLQWEDLNPAGGDFSITTNDYPHVAYDSYFIYSGVGQNAANFNTRSANNAYYHTGGLAIRGTATNSYVTLSSVRSVQVDGGATLEVNGDVTFTSLVVDASKGCGTVKGGSFPSDGTVQVENWTEGDKAKTMPFDLSGTTDPENISRWGVAVGGAVRSRWHVKYANGRLTVLPPGMTVSFR